MVVVLATRGRSEVEVGGYIRETLLNIEVEDRGEGRMKNIEKKNEPPLHWRYRWRVEQKG